MSQALLGHIGRYIQDFLLATGEDNEAGGVFVGYYERNEAKQVTAINLTGFIPAGPEADFSPQSIQFDSGYQEAAVRLMRHRNPRLRIVGSIHRHPGRMDYPSPGDRNTDRRALLDSDGAWTVTGIITVDNPRRHPGSLTWENHKLDFHVLGEATAYDYQRVNVHLVDGGLESYPEAWIPVARLRGAALSLDLRALQSLGGIVSARLAMLGPGEAGCPCLVVQDKASGVDIILCVLPDQSLECRIRREGHAAEILGGPWEDPAAGPSIWFTEVVCAVRRSLRGLVRRATAPRRYFAPWWERDIRRLELEKRAMHEAFGPEVVLYQSGGQLFWRAILRESGRELPVRIVYPDGYPNVPPQIHSEKALPTSGHSLWNNGFCWIPHTGSSDWNPARDSAAVALAAAYRWYASLLVFLTLGRWPKSTDHSPEVLRRKN